MDGEVDPCLILPAFVHWIDGRGEATSKAWGLSMIGMSKEGYDPFNLCKQLKLLSEHECTVINIYLDESFNCLRRERKINPRKPSVAILLCTITTLVMINRRLFVLF